MERSLISLNVPNFITIGLMAVGSFLVVGTIWQLISKSTGNSGAPEDGVTISTGGSYAPAS